MSRQGCGEDSDGDHDARGGDQRGDDLDRDIAVAARPHVRGGPDGEPQNDGRQKTHPMQPTEKQPPWHGNQEREPDRAQDLLMCRQPGCPAGQPETLDAANAGGAVVDAVRAERLSAAAA